MDKLLLSYWWICENLNCFFFLIYKNDININVLRFDTPKYDTSQEKFAFIEFLIKMPVRIIRQST